MSQDHAPQDKSAVAPTGPSAAQNGAPHPTEEGMNGIEKHGESDNFEVIFKGDDDTRSPRSMSKARKWMLVLIVTSASLCVACTSSIYSTTYDQLEREFGCSEIVATLGLSLFNFGVMLSPMILAPLSEFYGRKPIYIGSYFFSLIWLIPCAVAKNIQTLIIVRFLNGFSGALFLGTAGSTVGDLFSKGDLQAPMTFYTTGPFLGPEIGPILGGFINFYTDWRWTFYLLLIWTGVHLVLIIFVVPETYQPVLQRNAAQKLRKETGDDRYHAPIEKLERSIPETILKSIYRPFLLLFFEPMCLNLCIFTALLLGIIYLFFGALPLVFTTNHGFNLWQDGLSFLGLAIGMLVAIACEPFWRRNYLRLLARHAANGWPGESEPEYRLPQAIAGAPLCTIGLFWFGWTTYRSVHWIVPIIGSSFFGAGLILCFSGVWTFLVESYPLYGASALAANSFSRNLFAGAFPLFGHAMYDNLGFQWASFLLAMITLVMAPFPYIFYKYGKRIRQKSRFTGQR